MKKPKKTAVKKPLHHHVARHAKTLFRITPKFVHGMVLGAFVGIIVVMTLRATQADALSITSPRDCDSNAVINCGALNTTELQQRYSYKGVAAIYSYFGISAADISSIGTTAVAGRVYKNGVVMVGNTNVANAAITAGRENITGSTKVTSGGQTFYKRPPSVSFKPTYINAFVVMKNGVFKYAILGPCGNPVVATSVIKATPTPPPPVTTTPPPVETPPPTPPETPVITTPSTQTPASTQIATVAAATTPAELPKTGPGAVMIVALLSVVGGYVFHVTHRHIKHRIRTRRTA